MDETARKLKEMAKISVRTEWVNNIGGSALGLQCSDHPAFFRDWDGGSPSAAASVALPDLVQAAAEHVDAEHLEVTDG